MNTMNHVEPYVDFVRSLYSDKDIAHDFRHIERIISRLSELSDGVIPVPLPHKLNFLACFHGLSKRIHEEAPLRQETTKFLRNLGWEQKDIDEVFASLITHIEDPKTPEEMVVYDANAYEVTGPFGIAKAFTVGGALGQTYEQTIAIYENNLDRVVFRTPVGKRLSQIRKAYAKDFLERLRSEL